MYTKRTVALRNGVEMPILGFGVYQIPPEQTEQAVSTALERGYRHIDIDTAAAYFNEEAVGRIGANLDVFGFELTEQEMARITETDAGKSLFFDHRDPAVQSLLAKLRVG